MIVELLVGLSVFLAVFAILEIWEYFRNKWSHKRALREHYEWKKKEKEQIVKPPPIPTQQADLSKAPEALKPILDQYAGAQKVPEQITAGTGKGLEDVNKRKEQGQGQGPTIS